MSYRNMGRMTLIAAAVAALSCSNELNRSASPVLLLVTNTQTIHQIDLAGGTGCDSNIGTISVSATLKNPGTVDQTFNQVRITRYRVSYVRTDGGSAVPAPFVRSTDMLISPGAAGSALSDFLVLTADQVTQAPFASLLPQNGGRDPETQRQVVRMDVIIDVFGETLAGTDVSGRTRFPLDFCYKCNPLGCS